MGRKRLVLWCLASFLAGAGFCLGTVTIIQAHLEGSPAESGWQGVEKQTIIFLLLAIFLIGCGISAFILAKRAFVEEVFRNYFKPGTWEAAEAARRKGYQLVHLSMTPSDEQYEICRNLWVRANDAEIRLDPAMSSNDCYRWIGFLMTRLGDGFADNVLACIVELEHVDDPVWLGKILSVGDKSARTAVCLREGLSQGLQDQCSRDEDDDVRHHFAQRYPAHRHSADLTQS